MNVAKLVPSALLFVLAACGPPCPRGEVCTGGPDSGTPQLIELGTGNSTFIALKDGDEVMIIKGPQGGYHIWGSIRAKAGLNPRELGLVTRVTKGTQEISTDGFRLKLVANGEFNEWYGMIMRVPEPADVKDQEVTLRMEATDVDGVKAVDQRRVIPKGP